MYAIVDDVTMPHSSVRFLSSCTCLYLGIFFGDFFGIWDFLGGFFFLIFLRCLLIVWDFEIFFILFYFFLNKICHGGGYEYFMLVLLHLIVIYKEL